MNGCSLSRSLFNLPNSKVTNFDSKITYLKVSKFNGSYRLPEIPDGFTKFGEQKSEKFSKKGTSNPKTVW